jgi:CDP-paratose 2-epimerase
VAYESVVVTGGAGFIGSNLAVMLKSRYPKNSITAVDNLKRRGSEQNLPRLQAAGVRFTHADLRCLEDMASWGGECDLIIDCSAEPSVMAGHGDASLYVINTNLVSTVHCLELARRYGADLVFLSTSRVYPVRALNALPYTDDETRFALTGEPSVPGASMAGINEEFPLAGSRTLYGATKLASEILIEEYRQAHGVRAVINRCGIVAGPWQMGKVDQGVFTYWMLAHYFGQPLRYIGFGGSGKQVRDLLHVRDLFDVIDRQLVSMDTVDGGVFNIGGGPACSLSLREATQLCRELTGNRVDVRACAEERPGDVRIYLSDSSRVRAQTSWEPRSSPQDILADIHAWIRANEKQLRQLLQD